MSLEKDIMKKIVVAMKAKDKVALESLRAVKSEIILAKTAASGSDELTEEQELKLLQKLVKQRKDSATLFTAQGRSDLAEPELAQAAIIAEFLPEQMSEDKVREIVAEIVAKVDASSMKDMGKVMGMANKALAGKADGKTISTIIKALLS
jgi:uncharacterized protein YqeY